MQPEQQRSLCRIADGSEMVRVGVVEIGRGVRYNTLLDAPRNRVLAEPLPRQPHKLGGLHTHLILRERTRLIGADDRYRPHGLARMHRTGQRVLFHEALHAERQTECHCHRQALRRGDHDKRDGNHDAIEQVLDHIYIQCGMPRCPIRQHTPHKNNGGYGVTDLSNNAR